MDSITQDRLPNPSAAGDFRSLSASAAADERLINAIGANTMRQYEGRRERMLELPDPDGLRSLAGEIKQHTLDHLDYYLEQFESSTQRNGGRVHFANDGAAARRIIADIAKQAGCTRVIKSKSMASEEIELAQHLEAAGLDLVETDLGEFILQIGHEKPSHLVAPVMHKDRASIATLFSEYFKTPYNDDPPTLTAQARIFLRDKFRHADLGITGGNFLVAETGQVCVVENEGNARQSITTPRVLVSLVGIEKFIPRLSDLAVMLKLLARSATGQRMTVYTSIFGGPRQGGEKDGPEEFHIVLLNNGRTEILASDYRETLRCIRCGACLNACPVYRKIGGHAYGGVYAGPIGALITPLFQGLEKFSDLPQASSLCGACYEVCPVKINIPKHLINLRRDISKRHINSAWERFFFRVWAWGMKSPLGYYLLCTMQKFDLRRRAHKTGWIRSLPRFAAGWTLVRDMPAPARRTFHQIWKDRK
jgi:L-lactate dehydrogenase complex protein LldF